MKKVLVGLVVLFVGMQLVRPDRVNPPVTGEVQTTPEVKALLKRACYDCHSNETVWPWYSNVAPISWVVAHDVDEGRRELNFSEWASYEPKRQAHKLEETEEMVEKGEMPLGIYVVLHAEAKLTEAEKKTLIDWAKQR